jgi:serine/threonine protein phosphatase PrpC
MIFEYFCLTDPGLVRDNNEDSVALDPDNQIVVLADGMGGYNAGEVASAMATTFIRTELGRWMSEGGHEASARELKRAMEICIDNANRSIFNAANSNAQYAGMGTTLVMGVFHGARAMIGHVGDSRCYRLRAGKLRAAHARPLACCQQQLDAGAHHGWSRRSTLTQQATSSPAPSASRPTVLLEVQRTHGSRPDDLYLLCSDGLSDMVSRRAALHAILVTEARLEVLRRKVSLVANIANETAADATTFRSSWPASLPRAAA